MKHLQIDRRLWERIEKCKIGQKIEMERESWFVASYAGQFSASYVRKFLSTNKE